MSLRFISILFICSLCCNTVFADNGETLSNSSETIDSLHVQDFSTLHNHADSNEQEDISKEKVMKGVFAEEGKFQRKSVSYVDALMILDGVYDVNVANYTTRILDELKKNIQLGRFDYISLPENIKREFVSNSNHLQGKMSSKKLLSLIEETLLPPMKDILEKTVDIRGLANISDAQKQSMLAVKAKEIGLTEEQIVQLMNSAYLYIPVVRGITKSYSNDNISYVVDLGIIWYQVKSQKNEVIIKKEIYPTSTFGIASRNKIYPAYGGADNFAFESALSAAINNLVVETKMIPDFNITGQIIGVDGNSAKVEIGEREGLTIDDKYLFMIASENESGEEVYKELGYGFVNYVGKNKTDSADFDPSNIKIVKSSSMIEEGVIATEYSRLGAYLGFGIESFPVKLSSGFTRFYTEDDVNISGNSIGLHLDLSLNVGKYIGISQLYMTAIGYTFGINSPISTSIDTDYGTYDIDMSSFSKVNFLSFSKYIYFKSFSVGLDFQPEYIYSNLNSSNDFFDSSEYGTVSIYLGGSLNYSLNKNLDLKLKFGSSIMDGEEYIDYDGLRIGLNFVYEPGKLPFDPLSIIKAQLSI